MNEPLTIRVPLGDEASMVAPVSLEWHLRYGDPVRVRYIAAEAVAGLDYLIRECTKEEAWGRLKACRAALIKTAKDKE